MQIMRNTPSMDVCQTVQCLEKRQTYSKVCAAFAARNLTTSLFCSLLAVFCSFFTNVPTPELSNVGQTQNIPSTEPFSPCKEKYGQNS